MTSSRTKNGSPDTAKRRPIKYVATHFRLSEYQREFECRHLKCATQLESIIVEPDWLWYCCFSCLCYPMTQHPCFQLQLYISSAAMVHRQPICHLLRLPSTCCLVHFSCICS